MPATSPNQVVISKFTYEPCSGKTPEEKYLLINQDAMKDAMNNLSTMGAFKLWCYLSKNTTNYTLALSQVDCADWGIKRTAYYDAKKELMTKGYLVEIDAGHLEFIQRPESGIRNSEKVEPGIRI